MTSKEALKSICLECEKEKGVNKVACPFRSISNDYCEEFETIEKELKVLEILKKKMIIDTDYYDSDDGCEEFEYIAYNGQPLNIENKQEYDLLKELLENENNK